MTIPLQIARTKRTCNIFHFQQQLESGHRLSRFTRCLACGVRLVRLHASSNYRYQPKCAMRPPENQPQKECPGLCLISEQTTRIGKYSNALHRVGRPGGSVSNLENLLTLGSEFESRCSYTNWDFPSCLTSGERLVRGYTEFDCTIDDGKGRLNPSRDKH